ncbi:MAG: ABC transporter permease [Candidatus Methanomethylophilaceae archaeon]|nr:ABC transporter permease [Candidatus Methanomethylophilaceae archaeon]
MMNIFSRLARSVREVYENRIILMALIRRNTAGRYKSSYVGFAWHLFLPILTIVVLVITFTAIRPRAIPEFWIYLSAGMFPVTFLSACLRGSAITKNAKYITKMKIPREIVVIASALTDFLTVVFAYLVVIIVILASGQYVDWSAVAALPLALLFMLIFGMGCSFITSTLTVFVKDIGHFLGVAMRLVIWVTPTFFLASEATGLLGIIVWYNPFTYYVEMFHDILYYGIVPHMEYVVIAIIMAVVVFLFGAAVFFHYEKRFPEVL